MALSLGALTAGNRYLDRWQNLSLEDAASGKFCQLANGWRIHYQAQGPDAGEPVVLVHGFMDSLSTWRQQMDALSVTRRVIAFDLPGFGNSERVTEPIYSLRRMSQLLAEFFDLQGITRAAIVGHSLGGALAAQFAYDFPDKVGKLVLEDAAVYLRVPLVNGHLSALPRFVWRGAFGLYSMRGVGIRAGLIGAFGNPVRIKEESVQYRTRALRVRGTPEALVALVESPRDSDLPGGVSQIVPPTLVIWGARDRTVPLAQGRRLRRELPNARLAIFSKAGHLPHEEFPQQVNTLLNGFLDDGLENVNGFYYD